MIGVYKFTNNINNKVYVGQSNNIEKRFKDHKYAHLNPKHNNYHCKFYQALRKYGFEHFTFEILEETRETLSREVFYIKEYNSYSNGYNSTYGGEDNPSFNPEIVRKRTEKLLFDKEINNKLRHQGEKNPNASLTEKDVVDIRTRLKIGDSKPRVFADYMHKISESGFDYCWRGKTWQEIMPEVYINRKFENRGGSKLTSEDIFNIRMRLRSGESRESVYSDYSCLVGKGGFRKIALGYTWKNIVV